MRPTPPRGSTLKWDISPSHIPSGDMETLRDSVRSCPSRNAMTSGPYWASDILANGCYRSTLTYLLSASSVRFDSVRDTLVRHFYADDYDGFRNTFIPARDIDSQAIE